MSTVTWTRREDLPGRPWQAHERREINGEWYEDACLFWVEQPGDAERAAFASLMQRSFGRVGAQ